MEQWYADEKEDKPERNSREEEPAEPQEPTHTSLTLTPPNVEELKVAPSVNTAIDIDAAAGLTNHPDGASKLALFKPCSTRQAPTSIEGP